MRVLVIDDDQMVANSIGNFLKFSMEHTVEICFNGVDAVNAASSRYFDLIICDLKMPDFDGFSIFNQINKPDRDCPEFILVSGFFTSKNLEAARNMGIKYCMKKPVQITQLITIIYDIIRNKQMRYSNEI